MTPNPRSYAPWTPLQVMSLNRRQAATHLHPYTCECGRTLAAMADGWRCPCGYRQEWAWRDDADGRWQFHAAGLKIGGGV